MQTSVLFSGLLVLAIEKNGNKIITASIRVGFCGFNNDFYQGKDGNVIRKIIFFLVLTLCSGCSPAAGGDYTAGDLRAMNHVAGTEINWFSVNGYGGSLTGNTCCILLPFNWTPSLKVKIDWEVDPNPREFIPMLKKGFGYEPEAYARHSSKYKKYSRLVDVPPYGLDRCGMSVHFLACNEVKVTTTCVGYGTPTYPIKEPLDMLEPDKCP